MQPDYSRQQQLKEIGAAGQATLARSRVLIVGLGGLGSPVLQYLAGAGVGTLELVEADTLDASNLHRQPIYALNDAGKPKLELARQAAVRINPTVKVATHAARFTSLNALDLLRRCDVVVDCSDNFRTKFLINDAAVLEQKPAVFASVYQYEGQLQIYKPEAAHACLRCLWPDAAPDGMVGNCAESGVLGPVPGVLGAMQALMVLKILLKIPGQLEGELLLLDFTNFSSARLKARRHSECSAPGCARIRELPGEEPDLQIELPSLAAAAAQGLQVIDIRNLDEFEARPTQATHIPMPLLLANPQLLPSGAQYLLVCASGKRSLVAARELHRRGHKVHSLAGGVQGLQH